MTGTEYDDASPLAQSKRQERPCDLPVCQVAGCGADLSGMKDYHKRYKVCDFHTQANSVIIPGSDQPQRYCQQCGRFHNLEMFDGTKRSCRDKLAQHNARRRKIPARSSSDRLQRFHMDNQLYGHPLPCHDPHSAGVGLLANSASLSHAAASLKLSFPFNSACQLPHKSSTTVVAHNSYDDVGSSSAFDHMGTGFEHSMDSSGLLAQQQVWDDQLNDSFKSSSSTMSGNSLSTWQESSSMSSHMFSMDSTSHPNLLQTSKANLQSNLHTATSCTDDLSTTQSLLSHHSFAAAAEEPTASLRLSSFKRPATATLTTTSDSFHSQQSQADSHTPTHLSSFQAPSCTQKLRPGSNRISHPESATHIDQFDRSQAQQQSWTSGVSTNHPWGQTTTPAVMDWSPGEIQASNLPVNAPAITPAPLQPCPDFPTMQRLHRSYSISAPVRRHTRQSLALKPPVKESVPREPSPEPAPLPQLARPRTSWQQTSQQYLNPLHQSSTTTPSPRLMGAHADPQLLNGTWGEPTPALNPAAASNSHTSSSFPAAATHMTSSRHVAAASATSATPQPSDLQGNNSLQGDLCGDLLGGLATGGIGSRCDSALMGANLRDLPPGSEAWLTALTLQCFNCTPKELSPDLWGSLMDVLQEKGMFDPVAGWVGEGGDARGAGGMDDFVGWGGTGEGRGGRGMDDLEALQMPGLQKGPVFPGDRFSGMGSRGAHMVDMGAAMELEGDRGGQPYLPALRPRLAHSRHHPAAYL